MTVFRLSGGAAKQRAIVRLALKDINKVVTGGRGPWCARANGPACRQIVISADHFEPPDDDKYGYFVTGPRHQTIALHADMKPSQLYGVFLHEFGHYLGLEHRSSGLMAPIYAERSWGRLTLSLRRRLAGELGTLLLRSSLSAFSHDYHIFA